MNHLFHAINLKTVLTLRYLLSTCTHIPIAAPLHLIFYAPLNRTVKTTYQALNTDCKASFPVFPTLLTHVPGPCDNVFGHVQMNLQSSPYLLSY